MKKTDRRTFLKLGGLALGGLMLPIYGCENEKNGTAGNADTTRSESRQAQAGSAVPFGIQLWTVREEMAKDPKGTLKKLAGYGYKQIENFEGQNGLWWGMQPAEYKSYIEDLGMKLVASHANMKENLENKVREAGEAGLTYLIDPYEGPQETLDDYRRLAESFNRYGKICQDNGLKFAYHNHDYSFKEVEGEIPHKIFMEQTDPALVDFEMDIYWVVTAGEDPVKWLKDYEGRWKLCHIKDRMKDIADNVTDGSTELGTGQIDYDHILKVAKDTGMEYYIVEQERYDNSSPLGSSEKNAAYMKGVRL